MLLHFSLNAEPLCSIRQDLDACGHWTQLYGVELQAGLLTCGQLLRSLHIEVKGKGDIMVEIGDITVEIVETFALGSPKLPQFLFSRRL